MVSFSEFLKNPVVGMLFVCLLAIGYLYYDNKSVLTKRIEELQTEVETLKKDYKELNEKFISTIEDMNQK